MTTDKCSCGETEEESCTLCSAEGKPLYWCDSCRKEVAEKRCPLCGLKARRVREDFSALHKAER